MSEPKLSHVDAAGVVRMVDVSDKEVTRRRATASGVVTLGEAAFAQVSAGAIKKGDVLTTARIAGIQAAKRTAELIPLCHGLSSDHVEVTLTLEPPGRVRITAETTCMGRTGVEMEALTAVSVAALTVYDMCKAVSKAIEIGPIRLESKSGGRSGDWRRDG